jgi:No apical meristem-associated C-terminal domain
MGGGKDYSVAENLAICKAWVQASEDPIAGKDQKGTTFFAKVFVFYNENMNAVDGEADNQRTGCAIKNRWCKINHDVNVFNGFYATVTSIEHSGWEEEDYINATKAMYSSRALDNKPFLFIECWKYLTKFPKWSSLMGCAKRKKPEAGKNLVDSDVVIQNNSATASKSDMSSIDVSSVTASSKDDDSARKRPRGTDTAKEQKVKEENKESKRKQANKMIALVEKRNKLIEEQNMLHIISLNKESPTTKEFFRQQSSEAIARYKKLTERM